MTSLSLSPAVRSRPLELHQGAATRFDPFGGRRGQTGPPGPFGPGVEAMLGGSTSYRALLPMRTAASTGTMNVVYVGDSNTECVGSTAFTYGWPSQLTAALRAVYGAIGGDQGRGYIGAGSWFGPTLSSKASVQVGGGGLDGRAVVLPKGETVTWPAQSCAGFFVMWTSTFFNRGTADVLVDGTKVGSIDGSAGTAQAPGQAAVFVPPGGAGSHVVQVKSTSATASFQVEGVFFVDNPTGVHQWAAGRSGSKAMDWAGDPYWARSLAVTNANLVVIGLGGNDMDPAANWGAGVTPAQFGASLAQMVTQINGALPVAPSILVVVGAERLDDAATGDTDRAARYHQAATLALAVYSNVRIVSEAELWAPVGVPPVDRAGWLRAGDRIHRSDFGNRLVGTWLTGLLLPGQGAGAVPGPPGPPGVVTADNLDGDYQDHQDTEGTVTLDSRVGTHVLTLTGDVVATVTDAAPPRLLVIYAAPGGHTLTVQDEDGVTVGALTGDGTDLVSLVLQRIRDTWRLASSGGGGEAPAANPPSVPAALVVSAVTDTTATVSWSASTDPAGAAVSYQVATKTSAGAQSGWSVAQSGTTYNLTGLTGSTSYTVLVRAKSSGGASQAGTVALTTHATPGWSTLAHESFTGPAGTLIGNPTDTGPSNAVWATVAGNDGDPTLDGNGRGIYTQATSYAGGGATLDLGAGVPSKLRATMFYDLTGFDPNYGAEADVLLKLHDYDDRTLMLGVDYQGHAILRCGNPVTNISGATTGLPLSGTMVAVIDGTSVTLTIGSNTVTGTLTGPLTGTTVGIYGQGRSARWDDVLFESYNG